MNDNVAVRIVGDASGVAPAIDLTKSEIASIAPIMKELNATMAGLTAQMKEGFLQGAADAKVLKSSVEGVAVAAHEGSAGIAGMVARIHEGAESVRTFQMRAKEFAEVYVAMFAVEKVVEWTKQMAEAAEHVHHLAEQFGMSVPEVQRLQGVATATGISMDALAKGMAILDKNAVNAVGGTSAMANAFKAVGVSANDGRTQMEKLEVVADKFKNMDDGPKKVALAMELFGKSGRELIPVLNMGSEGIAELSKKTEEYGAVSESANEKGVALAESVNESKLAFSGVGQVLTDAFAPVMKDVVDGLDKLILAFVESYKEGGVVADVFTVISGVIEATGAVINALADVFEELWSVVSSVIGEIVGIFVDLFGATVPKEVGTATSFINVFKDTMVVLKDTIIIVCEIIKGALLVVVDYCRMFAKVAHDALTMNWSQIDGDWQAGCDRMARDVENAAGRIKAAMAEAGQAINAALHGEALPSPKGGIPMPKGGGGSFDPDLGKTPKAKKEAKPKDDLVQKLEEELEAKKTAWGLEQEAQGTAQQFSLQSEADYWAAALQRTDLSAKDKLGIEKKWLAARQAIQKDQIADQLEVYKSDIEEAGKNWTEKLSVLKAEETYISKMYGAQSKEANAARDAVIKAEHEKADQLRQLSDQVQKHQADLAMMDIDEREKAAQAEVELGAITNGKLLDQERQFENQRHQIHRAAMVADLALVDPNRDPVKFQQLSLQIETLDRQHQAKLTEIDRKAILQRTQLQRTAIGSMSSGFASTLSQMLTLQKSFGESIKSIWQTIQQTVAGALESIIEQWLTKQLSALILGKAQQQAAGSGEIASNAAVAASGAYAATAAIPIVGPGLAPAAAATAYGGAMSWLGALSVGSFDVGAWDLSKDQIAAVHKGEMVIPAEMASGMRAMFKGAANGNSPSAANDGGGGMHLHLHGDLIHNPSQLKRWFETNRHAVGAGVRSFARQGGNTSPNR